MTTLWNDLRYGLRMLAKNPGFTVVAVLITAIGIAAVTVMFSVLRGVVLRPLPFRQPERLVWAQAVTNQGTPNSVSAMDYFDYREQCDTFESLAARCVWQPGRIVTGRAEAERVASCKVSANFFRTLGSRPWLGRPFSVEEETAGGPNVVVVSRGFWNRKLEAPPDLAGAQLTIDGAVYDVVGVMPEDFDYPQGVEMWFPMQRGGGEESGRGNNNFFMIGRLADGVDRVRAQGQMAAVALAATRWIATQLYGVGPTDALTLAAACLVLAGTAVLASILPAVRAAAIDPMQALRCE
jgi:putative ABC transport system permease protein